jgi:hypothetical protein
MGDPGFPSDDTPTVDAVLNEGLGANEHTISYIKCFQMLESNPAVDMNAMAESSGNGTPNRCSHQRIHISTSAYKGPTKLDQSIGTIGLFLRLDEFDFKIRVRFNLFSAVEGFNYLTAVINPVRHQ